MIARPCRLLPIQMASGIPIAIAISTATAVMMRVSMLSPQ